MRTLTLALALVVAVPLAGGGGPAAAQQQPPAADGQPQQQQQAAPQAAPSFDELQATIARMQRQVDAMGQATAERDKALEFLARQVDQAAGQIGGTGEVNDRLRGETATLSDQVQGISAERDRLAAGTKAQADLLGEVGGRLAALEARLGDERRGKEALGGQLAQAQARLAELERALEAERTGRSEGAERLEGARGQLEALGQALDGERRVKAGLERELAEARTRLAALEGAVGAERRGRGDLAAELERARAELAALRSENDALEGRLAREAGEDAARETRIAELDRQLRESLARQVEELERYRSEFFGRLRQVLGERSDVRVVGDRFVLQSEVLFDSGSATLGAEGQARLRELAATLRDVAATIPPDVDWVLRVDGHTDRLPVRHGPFTSNWELSAARAISVVEFLVREGIPAGRLAAAGFGEFRPLDARDDEIAYRRNRRIELKLTEG